ncbi:MAG: T9SS type A sorting domain-containing protein [Muribaculaceae bacterium]|nr:T9SS type A sorting domain-containing protein [Muribaculaceae bacterium]
MKKFLLSLAALTLSTGAAFALDAISPYISGVNFSAPGQEEVDEGMYMLDNPEVTITMQFEDYDATGVQALGYSPKVMVATGMGFGVEPVLYELDTTSSPSVFTFTMNEKRWGQPYMGMLNAVCMVCFGKGEGDDMELMLDNEEEPLFFQAVYAAENNFPARFMYASPNGVWEDETFADAYNRGEVSFVFSNPVTFTNLANIGKIRYVGEGFDESYDITDYTSDWDMLNGLWAVTFALSNEDFTAEDLSRIVITLSGVESVIGESSITVKPLELSNVASPAPRKIKKAMERDLTSGNELVNIYNVQGTLVKESVNRTAIKDLPAGLYIVDGKKYVVR